MTEPQLLELVGLIYDAAQDRSRWTEFLQRYASVLNFHIAQIELVAPDASMSVVSSIGLTESDIQDFARFSRLNPWAPLFLKVPAGAVDASHHRVPQAEYLESDYYHEFGKRIDQHYGQAGVVIASSSAFSVMSAVRHKSQGPCGQPEIDFLRALMPHLARSLRMHGQFARLEAQASSLLDCLDRLARGFVLLDERGQVIRANHAAERMAAQRDGLHLSVRGLTASDAAESAALQKLIFEAAQTASGEGLASGGTLTISRPSLRRPWIVTVSPHKTQTGDGLAAVLLADPDENPAPSANVVAQTFGFTQSETRLAVLLSTGVRLEDAADQLGITMNTARTHTQRMLDKTGVSRQIDLILLLNKMPANES